MMTKFKTYDDIIRFKIEHDIDYTTLGYMLGVSHLTISNYTKKGSEEIKSKIIVRLLHIYDSFPHFIPKQDLVPTEEFYNFIGFTRNKAGYEKLEALTGQNWRNIHQTLKYDRNSSSALEMLFSLVKKLGHDDPGLTLEVMNYINSKIESDDV